MASKYKAFSFTAKAGTTISSQPGSLDRILVGSNNGNTLALFDGTATQIEQDTAETLMGSYVTATRENIEIEAKFENGCYMTVDPGAGNSVKITALYNGDPLR